MSEKIATLSDASFDEHVKAADVPVLVDSQHLSQHACSRVYVQTRA